MDQAFVNEWGRDPRKPVVVLTKEEMLEAYVVVNGEDIKLSLIPDDFRTAAIKKLTEAKRPVSEQAIAERWVRAGKPR